MRELTFGLSHEPGTDRLMSTFHDYPGLRMRSLHCGWEDGTYWRLDRADGARDALAALDDAYVDGKGCPDCLVEADAVAERAVEPIERATNRRVYYGYWRLDGGARPLPGLADEYVDPGAVFESTRSEGEHWWRLLLRSDRKVGVFYDTLQAALPAHVRYLVGHLTDADSWAEASATGASLTGKQERVVETASAMGYYERPRGAGQAEIADELGLPRSTVSYRLRRAEAALVDAYVDD